MQDGLAGSMLDLIQDVCFNRLILGQGLDTLPEGENAERQTCGNDGGS